MPKPTKSPKAVSTVPRPEAYQKIPVPESMTPRQAHVILLACLGNHDGEIGVMVGIGYETVRDEMDKLRNLTGLRRKLALSAWALTHFAALEKLCGRPVKSYAGNKPCPSTTPTKSSPSHASGARRAIVASAPSSARPASRSRTLAAAR